MMRYVTRDADGKIIGHFAVPQFEGQELLEDNHPDLEAFKNPPKPLPEQLAEMMKQAASNPPEGTNPRLLVVLSEKFKSISGLLDLDIPLPAYIAAAKAEIEALPNELPPGLSLPPEFEAVRLAMLEKLSAQ